MLKTVRVEGSAERRKGGGDGTLAIKLERGFIKLRCWGLKKNAAQSDAVCAFELMDGACLSHGYTRRNKG